MSEAMERKVFLDDLPHSKNGKQILWRECIGLSFKFIYDNIKGVLYILNYDKDTQYIILKYNNKTYKTKTSDILMCRLTYVLGLKVREFKYNIGSVIHFKTGDIIITKQLRNNKGKRYEYRCFNCKQFSEIQEEMIGKTINCPICCNNPQKVVMGINDISTTDKWIIPFLKNEDDSYKYSRGSNKKVVFKCPSCGYEKEMKLSQFTTYGLSCPKCSDGFSMGSKFMFNILQQLNIDFETEKRFDWCRYKYENKIKQGVYDFYLPHQNIIIEMDGKQHKKQGNMFKISLKKQQYIDSQKDKLAKEHGIKVIRIDCEYTDLKYIKNNIINNLNEILDTNIIDWDIVYKNVISSKIKECCERFNNENLTTTELSLYYKVSNVSIISWLKVGTSLNWCNYNGEYENKRIHSKLNNKSSKRVEVLKNEQSLGVFLSGMELQRQSENLFGIKLTSSGISMACNGKLKQYKGFTFKYVDDIQSA